MNASDERFADVGRGVVLCYEQIGPADGRPLLLIAGLGQQLISWPTALCEQLAGQGFRVIRFDNRDVGRSTHFSFKPPSPVSLLLRRFPDDQYQLGAMARDAVGLLEALGIGSAHVVGASMGGMIAQTMAAQFPDRVSTLTSMMSTTGAPKIGQPAPTTLVRMLGRPARNRDESIRQTIRMFRHIGSHAFGIDEEALRAEATLAWERDGAVGGLGRQLAAILASGDRTTEVSRIQVPTLIIHGDRDRMVDPSGGLATHLAITGSKLATISGMGHDYPRGAWPRIVELIATHAGPPAPAEAATPPRGPSRSSRPKSPAKPRTKTSPEPQDSRSDHASSQA